ncbi:MAG TPA: Dyp-type peroxidase [Candidatus Corynebacterium avicola]|uniref:Dyp-type peroxidase n=1 Tax=Candidatus Corynebacterium avicola TaxID=2838527 RepID=A0A9D1RP00_9CORY|nr:Dyp-type peroxidase [Candidatus Corynebacterium avicola]
MTPRTTRRSFLTGVGVLSASAAVATATSCVSDGGQGEGSGDGSGGTADTGSGGIGDTGTVAFDGPHQAGVTTPLQSHNTTIAFTLRDGVDADGARRLLRLWTDDARRLCSGRGVLADLEPELSETTGNLTVTCGLGASFFERTGLGNRPEWLESLPRFDGDRLDDTWGERDIVLQVCGDDRTTLSHAVRVLVRGGADYARPSWSQEGFLDIPVDDDGEQGTPRNLFGFKDGTVNPDTGQEQDDHVWIGDGPHAGGTCMVVRRVAFDMPLWEAADRVTREVSMGRTIVEGAPIGGEKEFDEPDFEAVGDDGLPVIDVNSHIALATATGHEDTDPLLRRAYNYDLPVTVSGADDLVDAPLIDLADTGLIFTCFQRDPRRAFIPMQKRLAAGDRLNEWIVHVGSAVFYVPPGTDEDGFWGEELFD